MPRKKLSKTALQALITVGKESAAKKSGAYVRKSATVGHTTAKSMKKLHVDDRRRVMAPALRTAGDRNQEDAAKRSLKKVAGKPGSYTTKPGGRIKNSRSSKRNKK